MVLTLSLDDFSFSVRTVYMSIKNLILAFTLFLYQKNLFKSLLKNANFKLVFRVEVF